MESYKEQDTNAMSVVLAGHLFLSHFLAAGAALIIAENLDVASPTSRIILMMGFAGLLGILLTFNIQRAIRLLDWALLHLINGIPVRKLSQRGHRLFRWEHGPLVGLMARVDGLAERERPFTELRDLQLKQNSEAAAQEERNRLARDLHDSIKQQLFSIHIGTAAVQARWESDPDGAKTAVADVRANAKAALAEMNALLHQLAPEPLEKVGLVQALRVQCEALEHRSGTAVKVEISSLPEDERFPDGAQTALFRIAQELLSNVARHARAENVALQLGIGENDALQLIVTDDGQGFDSQTAPNGMGLGNVRQRVEALGGQLEIESAPNSGTSIRVSIPLQDSLTMKETRMNKPDHLFNKVAAIGLLGGIALNLLLVYPLIVALPDVIVPPKPTDSTFLAGLLGLTAVALTIAIGAFAARYAEVGTSWGNRLVGAIAGSISAFIFYLGYGSVTTNLIGSLSIIEHGLIPASSEEVYLWLLIEAITDTVWWTLGGFLLLIFVGFLLGMLGGHLVKRTGGNPERNWTYILVGGTALSFSMMMAALLTLVVTVATFSLLGEQVIEEAAALANMGFEWQLPIVGTAVLPILITFLVYFSGLLLLNWLFRQVQKRKEKPHFRFIISAYLAAFTAILLPFILLAMSPSPFYTAGKVTILIVSLIDVVGALLLLQTAVSLEKRYPEVKNRPVWAEIATSGLFITFIVVAGLTITGHQSTAFFLLVLAPAAYFFTPRYDIARDTTMFGNLIARTLEISFALLLLFGLTSSVIIPTASGLINSVVGAIPAIEPVTEGATIETAVISIAEIRQSLFLTTPLAPLAFMGLGLFFILLWLLVIKISQSWKR